MINHLYSWIYWFYLVSFTFSKELNSSCPSSAFQQTAHKSESLGNVEFFISCVSYIIVCNLYFHCRLRNTFKRWSSWWFEIWNTIFNPFDLSSEIVFIAWKKKKKKEMQKRKHLQTTCNVPRKTTRLLQNLSHTISACPKFVFALR